MAQPEVAYSCKACGYPLNLTSSNRIACSTPSKYSKSISKEFMSFLSVDMSRFTQVDEVACLPISCGRFRSKTKFLCRKCGVLMGYGYGASNALCGLESPTASSSPYKKITLKTQSLQPSD